MRDSKAIVSLHARLTELGREVLSPEGGFLPPHTPLLEAPAGFERYQALCDALPEHLHANRSGVRSWLDVELAEYDEDLTDKLDGLTHPELSKLATLLSVLGHGYRWDVIPSPSRDFDLPSLQLPRGLVEPWRTVSEKLGQPMVGTLWSLLLTNWTLGAHGSEETYLNSELAYENLQLRHNFLTGPMGEQMRAFVMALVLTEGHGAILIPCLLDAIAAVGQDDQDALKDVLTRLVDNMHAMNRTFSQLIRITVMDPVTWLDNIQRPYVWGVEDDGVRLEGPSGMQLGVMTCLNTALDIRNESELAKSISESRKYLLPKQRDFLELFDETRHIIRPYVRATHNRVLRKLYNQSLDMLIRWRKLHVTRGTLYFKGKEGDAGMETSTGLVVNPGENLLQHFQKAMEDRIIETQQRKLIVDIAGLSTSERAYIEEVMGSVDSANRLSINQRIHFDTRLQELGLSHDSADRLHALAEISGNFRANELIYMDIAEVFYLERASLDDDSTRESLISAASGLKISPERALVLEKHLLSAQPPTVHTGPVALRPPSADDLRQKARVDTNLDGEIDLFEHTSQTRITDLSLSGARLKLVHAALLRAGQSGFLDIDLDGARLSIDCEIVWFDAESEEVGVSFQELPLYSFQTLCQFIQEHHDRSHSTN